MGVDLTVYRQRIGSLVRSYKIKIQKTSDSTTEGPLSDTLTLSLLAIACALLLTTCGDVESNPGPIPKKRNGASTECTHRVTPRHRVNYRHQRFSPESRRSGSFEVTTGLTQNESMECTPRGTDGHWEVTSSLTHNESIDRLKRNTSGLTQTELIDSSLGHTHGHWEITSGLAQTEPMDSSPMSIHTHWDVTSGFTQHEPMERSPKSTHTHWDVTSGFTQHEPMERSPKSTHTHWDVTSGFTQHEPMERSPKSTHTHWDVTSGFTQHEPMERSPKSTHTHWDVTSGFTQHEPMERSPKSTHTHWDVTSGFTQHEPMERSPKSTHTHWDVTSGFTQHEPMERSPKSTHTHWEDTSGLIQHEPMDSSPRSTFEPIVSVSEAGWQISHPEGCMAQTLDKPASKSTRIDSDEEPKSNYQTGSTRPKRNKRQISRQDSGPAMHVMDMNKPIQPATTDTEESDSLRLYKTLERVGLSEEMRQCHKQVVTSEINVAQVYPNSIVSSTVYIFGSHSEGSTVRAMGSDIDILLCLISLPVVADVRHVMSLLSLLMVQDDHTKPGYVKLQLVVAGTPQNVNESNEDEKDCKDMYGRFCVPNLNGIEIADINHGPAICFYLNILKGIVCDIVLAFKCMSVPDCVKEWITRPRRYGWPTQKSMEHMKTLPHFVVGVGHPNSLESVLEWRVSYSLHERELMFSLNPTQHKCYGMMKMMKKDLIEPDVGEKSISSYHLKTCLFWVIEDTPADIWQPTKLFHCLRLCVRKLLECIQYKNCPNFFRRDSNLFDREEFYRLHNHLSTIIRRILDDLPYFITQIRCAGVGAIFQHNDVSREVLDNILIQRTHIIKDNIFTIFAFSKRLAQVSHVCRSPVERIIRLDQSLSEWLSSDKIKEHTETQINEARKFLLPCVHFQLAVCLASARIKTNTLPFGRPTLHHIFYNLSSGRDLVTSRLLYVTVLYTLGKYRQCERILNSIDRDLKPFVWSYCLCNKNSIMQIWKEDNTAFKEWVEENKPSARTALASAVATCVTFLPSERNLTPVPLRHELNRSEDFPDKSNVDHDNCNTYDWACLDGKVYFHMMQYLVYTKLNKTLDKARCSDNIQRVIDHDSDLSHTDAAYNVLGWIYAQEGDRDSAVVCWKKSWEIQPYHNAAVRHYSALLEKEASVP